MSPFGMQRRYSGAFRRRSGFRSFGNFRRPKPGLLSVNHCEVDPGTSTGGVTQQTAVFTVVEPPTNRGSMLPSGAVLKRVRIELWGMDATPVTGEHSCLMLFQPGATTYADPIAAWLSTTEPMTEEAIQVRQNIMQRMHRFVTITGASFAPHWICEWRGNKILRDADDIVVALNDAQATDWEGICEAWWVS